MSAIDDDFNNAFLSTDDFASDAVFTDGSNAPVDIKVIFDNEFGSSVFGRYESENQNSQALCKTSDVSTADHGDTLVIDSVTYYIIGVEPDGTGMTLLTLSRNANIG